MHEITLLQGLSLAALVLFWGLIFGWKPYFYSAR